MSYLFFAAATFFLFTARTTLDKESLRCVIVVFRPLCRVPRYGISPALSWEGVERRDPRMMTLAHSCYFGSDSWVCGSTVLDIKLGCRWCLLLTLYSAQWSILVFMYNSDPQHTPIFIRPCAPRGGPGGTTLLVGDPIRFVLVLHAPLLPRTGCLPVYISLCPLQSHTVMSCETMFFYVTLQNLGSEFPLSGMVEYDCYYKFPSFFCSILLVYWFEIRSRGTNNGQSFAVSIYA